MKEQKLYVCDYCGTQYKEKTVCQKCEKAHVKPVEIKDCKYIAMKDNLKGYPTQVHLKMADGTVQIYKR